MSSFERALHFLTLIQANPRISVRRLAREMGCTERQIYRYVKYASLYLPIRLESGVVVCEVGDGHQINFLP